MKKILGLLDGMLSDLRDSRIAARPAERVSLAPVWVMSTVGHPRTLPNEALLDGMQSDLRASRIAARPTERVSLAPVWVTPMISRSQATPNK